MVSLSLSLYLYCVFTKLGLLNRAPIHHRRPLLHYKLFLHVDAPVLQSLLSDHSSFNHLWAMYTCLHYLHRHLRLELGLARSLLVRLFRSRPLSC